jgi:hypothetical protein
MKLLQLHEQAKSIGFTIQADHGATLALIPFKSGRNKITKIKPAQLSITLTALQIALGE